MTEAPPSLENAVTGVIEVLVKSLGDLEENNDKMVRNFLEPNTQLEKGLLK